ncbi:MAG TPA: DUF937 domain-containing protein [Anseongella sp.]
MLDKLVELAKGQLLPSLIDDPDVDNAQAEEIARVSGDSVINSLMEQAKGGDLSGLQEMLSGNETDPANPAANQFVPKVAENLASRLGLSPEMAQKIAVMAIPLIMNMLNGKVKDAKDKGIDVGDLLGSLAGGGQGGGLIGKLGGLFGGKKTAAGGANQGGISDILGKFF